MRRVLETNLLLAAAVIVWPVAALVAQTPGPGNTKPQQQPATCIGVVLPVAEGIEGNASDVATAVRDQLTKDLSGPSLKVVALEARMLSAAIEEARKANCGHVLVTKLLRKPGGATGTSGVLGKMAEGAGNWAAWNVPGGGMGGAAVRGAAIAGAAAISSLASVTKTKDELRLEYQLMPNSDAPVAGPQTERLKAKSDGEDLVTPLVRRVAERVHAALAGK